MTSIDTIAHAQEQIALCDDLLRALTVEARRQGVPAPLLAAVLLDRGAKATLATWGAETCFEVVREALAEPAPRLQ